MCLQHILKSEFNVNIYVYMYMHICLQHTLKCNPTLNYECNFDFFSSCNFKLGDSEQNNAFNLHVHECCMQHTLKHNVKI